MSIAGFIGLHLCKKVLVAQSSLTANPWTVAHQDPWVEKIPWRRKWHPQYSCLENPMDGGAWWAAVHGVARSQTRLSNFTLFFHFHALEKEMATHSSVLTWRIPGTGSLVGCRLWGHRVGHDWSDLAAGCMYLFELWSSLDIWPGEFVFSFTTTFS